MPPILIFAVDDVQDVTERERQTLARQHPAVPRWIVVKQYPATNSIPGLKFILGYYSAIEFVRPAIHKCIIFHLFADHKTKITLNINFDLKTASDFHE